MKKLFLCASFLLSQCWGADQQEDKGLNSSILTGKPASAPIVWVEDMSKVIEYFFEPSDNRARVIEEINRVYQQKGRKYEL